MADKNSIAVLNIGAQRVGMGIFKQVKGQLVLKAYKSTEILADPAAASTRNAQIKTAVIELAKTLKVKNRVSYAVSGQSVFTRFVLLPDLEGIDVNELVENEAQQNIPFPLAEVKWDWQEVTEVEGEKEVVIAAIKSKVLNDIQDAVEGAGMNTTEVDPAPISLYNAFRLCYADIQEPCMLVDIGAKTSNIIYIDGERLFARSVAIGGATVTAAISKEYDVNFLEAENQKKENGQIALNTRHTSKLDELTGALASCIRNSLNRMPAEISRTTNFYRSQQGGSAPTRVFIAGGGSNLPNMADFLSDKLRLPVELFNPMRAVAVDKGVNVDEIAKDAHLMGELIGLAARRMGKSQLKLDLVPDSVQKEKELDKRKNKLIFAAIAFALGLMSFWLIGLVESSSLKTHEASLTEELKPLKTFATKMDAINADEQAMVPYVHEIIEVEEQRVHWIEMLNELKQQCGSKKYWFTEIKPLVNYTPSSLGEYTFVFSDGATQSTDDTAKLKEFVDKDKKINAIFIRGIWLDSGHGLQVRIKNYLGLGEAKEKEDDASNTEKTIKSNSAFFAAKLQYLQGKKEETKIFELKDIFKIKPEWDHNKIGSEFTMVLPLKSPIDLVKEKVKTK